MSIIPQVFIFNMAEVFKSFDELNVVSRFKEINDENHDYNISSGQFVKFSPIKEYTNFTSLIKIVGK